MTETTAFLTADLFDQHGELTQSCQLQLRDFGGHTRFSGPITTFSSPADNLVLKDIISEPGDGRVIVVDAGGDLFGAMIGENMAVRAAENGWAGLVINGAVRDTVALRGVPLGIKALGTIPRRSRKAGVGQRDIDVTFGAVTFHPGDTLFADEDGILLLPRDAT